MEYNLVLTFVKNSGWPYTCNEIRCCSFQTSLVCFLTYTWGLSNSFGWQISCSWRTMRLLNRIWRCVMVANSNIVIMAWTVMKMSFKDLNRFLVFQFMLGHLSTGCAMNVYFNHKKIYCVVISRNKDASTLSGRNQVTCSILLFTKVMFRIPRPPIGLSFSRHFSVQT